ncbi:MAG: helix-turn-helix transcriptional regulator [Peptostreptococcaceae bacterium]
MIKIHKLKAERVLKGIKQMDMAQKLGITPQYLSRIESGKVDIKLSTLKKIANILEVPVSDLIEEK